ncbi:hypothetical protein [uncultured Bacteroides sp.]|uniref:hypothetical protein n=1 Tax=uncultured Bacteroides sp. TaxID=162156 RepID=UPI002AA653EA|nr:hypothetical protein [uncultured Bacteroides sp.]
MRKILYLLLLLGCSITTQAQFKVSKHQEGWDNIPPQAVKEGFGLQKSILANMDNDPALEEVMLFGRDSGHYPTFDLFKAYYVIVDNYTKEVEYISDDIYITDKYELKVEDRNNDGISELYINYFKDGKFKTNADGYNLETTRCYDCIEWQPDNQIIKSKQK